MNSNLVNFSIKKKTFLLQQKLFKNNRLSGFIIYKFALVKKPTFLIALHIQNVPKMLKC